LQVSQTLMAISLGYVKDEPSSEARLNQLRRRKQVDDSIWDHRGRLSLMITRTTGAAERSVEYASSLRRQTRRLSKRRSGRNPVTPQESPSGLTMA